MDTPAFLKQLLTQVDLLSFCFTDRNNIYEPPKPTELYINTPTKTHTYVLFILGIYYYYKNID